MIAQLRQLKQAEESNDTFSMKDVCELYPEFQIVQQGEYYPYDNVHKDSGWGCAWRSIQLLLSSKKIRPGFDQLFNKFSRKQKLMKVIKQRIPQLQTEEIKTHKWAPEQNQRNWAEPFIGQLICEDNNLKTRLILVNGYPKCYAPESVFEQTISYESFRGLIKKVIPRSPIMIDDGQLALTIVGYHENQDEKFSIILADPHIYSNRVHKSTGIYEVILDKQGKQLKAVMGNQQKQSMWTSHTQIYFETKKWMVTYIQNSQ